MNKKLKKYLRCEQNHQTLTENTFESVYEALVTPFLWFGMHSQVLSISPHVGKYFCYSVSSGIMKSISEVILVDC